MRYPVSKESEGSNPFSCTNFSVYFKNGWRVTIIRRLDVKNAIIYVSIHNGNTEKVAKAFAKVLNADLKKPEQIEPNSLSDYELIGFGSGIYSEKHHTDLLDLADKLPHVTNKKAFIFSTCSAVGGMTEEVVIKNHRILKEKLQSKGYIIVDEFSCKGFNTNSFLKFFGGINKGRPNVEDLKNAERFTDNLIK
jgi:flavodoxin